MNTMKSINVITLLLVIFVSVSNIYAQKDMREENYLVTERVEKYKLPTTFDITKATPKNGAISENIMTSTERILNKEKPFLKKGVVKPIGEDDYSAWQMTSDEGGNPQSAPNPLTYFASGAASGLLTQVERCSQIMGIDIENVKVETEFYFRWNDIMTDEWSGYTDKVVTNIIIESDESKETINELKEMAINAWAIGEALSNKTTIDAATVINGDNWDGQEARPGKVKSPVSRDNGLKITDTTSPLKLETIKVKDDAKMSMEKPPKVMRFSEIAIAESANDLQRPYLHRIRAKSLTDHYETWELYTDDSRGYEKGNSAPTSRDLFTIGTSFCLMSQLTPNQMYFQKKGVNIEDFRVEHQFNYQQDNFMTPSVNGHLDNVITRVVVKSKASEKMIHQYVNQALRCCFAGEGIQNATEMQTSFYLNGKIVK